MWKKGIPGKGTENKCPEVRVCLALWKNGNEVWDLS